MVKISFSSLEDIRNDLRCCRRDRDRMRERSDWGACIRPLYYWQCGDARVRIGRFAGLFGPQNMVLYLGLLARWRASAKRISVS